MGEDIKERVLFKNIRVGFSVFFRFWNRSFCISISISREFLKSRFTDIVRA